MMKTSEKCIGNRNCPSPVVEPSRRKGYKWIATFEGGSERVIHASVLIGDIIYIIGGCRLDDADLEDKPIEIMVLHTQSFHWKILELPKQPLDEIPFMRYGHSVVAYNGHAYLFGGRSTQSFCNDLFRYDPVAHHWTRVTTTGCVPTPLSGHSMCLVGDKGFVYGGYKTTQSMYATEIFSLDFRNFKWSYVMQEGTPPSVRYFHSACVLDEQIYVFGGEAMIEEFATPHELYSNQIHCFDTVTSSWHCPQQRGDIPPGRRGHSVFTYNGQMFVFGGHNYHTGISYGDAYRFKPETATWKRFPIHVGPVDVPHSREGHTTVVAGSQLFLIGGITTFSVEEQNFLMQRECKRRLRDYEILCEHNGFFVLDLNPSLQTLCMAEVIRNNLDRSQLPRTVQLQMSRMFTQGDMICTACRNH